MTKTVEIVIYIHGVSQSPQEGAHYEEYGQLHKGIGNNIRQKPWPQDYCGVEWGGNPFNQPNPKNHMLLTKAQRLLGSRVMPVIDSTSDWTWNPARLAVESIRKLALYGFSDMFYYVSADGKKAVRSAVAKQITDFITKQKITKNDLLSITLIGHSAGSVAAFDFLFYLFSGSRSACEFCKENHKASDEMSKLEKRITRGKLRLRRLVTFGSPLSFTIFRNDDVLDILAGDQQLNPSDYGLTTGPNHDLDGPRWINLWDKDDPVSFPVEPLVDQSGNPGLVLDVYSDVSDLVTLAHNAYWSNKDVHGEIARRW